MIEHTFKSLQMIQTLETVSEEEIAGKKVRLDRKTNFDKAIVFDLDETLAHCTFNDGKEKRAESDIFLDIPKKSGGLLKAGFNLRRGYRDVLIESAKYFEVIVFTASQQDYADAILNYIDPDNSIIHHRFYRNSCVQEPTTGIYIKDLRIFEDYELQNIFLVDNAVYSFSFQIDNGIPIIPFRDNREDDQLEKLIKFLPIIAERKDA